MKSVEELEDLGFFGVQEIVPNRNFLLTEKGITYTYNKGEYSAYQLDAPEVFIPYSAIRSLLRENTPAAKLAICEDADNLLSRPYRSAADPVRAAKRIVQLLECPYQRDIPQGYR